MAIEGRDSERPQKEPSAASPIVSYTLADKLAGSYAELPLREIVIYIIMLPVTKLKIRAIGSSSGVILPKEILDRLNLGEGDELFCVEVGKELRLSPYDPDFEKAME